MNKTRRRLQKQRRSTRLWAARWRRMSRTMFFGFEVSGQWKQFIQSMIPPAALSETP